MTGDTLSVEFDTLHQLQRAYNDLAHGAQTAKSYIAGNCKLGDASGLLLRPLVPRYDQCKQLAESSFGLLSTALNGMQQQVEGAEQDILAIERAHQQLIESLARVLGITPRLGAGGGTGGGGTSSGGVVVGGEDATIDPGIAAEIPAFRGTEPRVSVGESAGIGQTTRPRSTTTGDAWAPTSAQCSAMAATDPLGRSEDEISSAWANREPLAVPSTSDTLTSANAQRTSLSPEVIERLYEQSMAASAGSSGVTR